MDEPLKAFPFSALKNNGLLADVAGRIEAAIRDAGGADIDKNFRQSLVMQLAQHGLVTREEYEVQVSLLAQARAKLAQLEQKIAALESAAPGPGSR
jgi:BMFP domain-containing protein YqiC